MNDSPIIRTFERNFTHYGEIGASVVIYRHGMELMVLHHGHTVKNKDSVWRGDTLTPVYSATKGAAAAALLLALWQQGHTPDTQAGEIWHDFPLPHATIAHIMSHQCGFAYFARQANVFDHQDCLSALYATPPAWLPNTQTHGYHPHTFGVLLDELMLRLTGERLWQFWESQIRSPLSLDFYLMLPESEFHRVATLYPGKLDSTRANTPFYHDYLTRGTPIYKSFNTLMGLNSVRHMNTPQAWTCGSPAFGAVASAQGMAQFYQACLGNDPLQLFPEQVRQWMQSLVISGYDRTMKTTTAFSCGLMMDPPNTPAAERLFGISGFGHPGAGGAHAFADPATGMSFAYTMNQMDLNVLPGAKTRLLVQAARQMV